MDIIRENRKKAQRKQEEAEEILNRAESQKRDLTDAEVAEFEGLMAEAKALRDMADRHERIENHALGRTDERRAVGAHMEVRGTENRYDQVEDNPEYRRAFTRWMRHGRDDLDANERAILHERTQALPIEQRALAAGGTGSAGGYAVPESFHRQVVEVMKSYIGVREAGATILRTADGTDLRIPTNDDTGEKGSIQDEGTAVSDQDPSFGQKTLGSFMYTSGLVKVSFQLLQDSAFPMEDFLARALGRRVGRVLNEHFTVGSGSGQPEGIVTALADASSVFTAAAPDSISYEDIIGLLHSIDPAYRGRGAAFMCNDTTVHALRGLKDLDDRPLWQPSLQAGQPAQLLGYPVITNPEMPDIGAEEISMTFGDHSRYFIRDVEGSTLLRLNERFADALQVGFIFYGRHDGVLTDANAVVGLEHPAT